MASQLSLHDITESMLKFGGSFVRSLAQTILLADEINTRRLIAAFPEYLDQYEEMALTDMRRRGLVAVALPHATEETR